MVRKPDKTQYVIPDKAYLGELSEIGKLTKMQTVGAAGGLPLPDTSQQSAVEKHILTTDAGIRKSYHAESEDKTAEVTTELIKAERSQQAAFEDVVSTKDLAIIALGDDLYRIKKLRRDFRRAKAQIKARELDLGRPIKEERLHKGYMLALFSGECLAVTLRSFFSDYEMGLSEALTMGLGLPFGNMVLIAGMAYAWFRSRWPQNIKLTVATTCLTVFLSANLYVAAMFTDVNNHVAVVSSLGYFLSIAGLMALLFADLKRVWSVSEEDRELLKLREKEENAFVSFKQQLEKKIAQLHKGFTQKLQDLSQNHLTMKENFKVNALACKRHIANMNSYLSKLTDITEELINDTRTTIRETVKDEDPNFYIPDYYYEDFKMDAAVTQDQASDDTIDQTIEQFDHKISVFDQQISHEKQALTARLEGLIVEVQEICHDVATHDTGGSRDALPAGGIE